MYGDRAIYDCHCKKTKPEADLAKPLLLDSGWFDAAIGMAKMQGRRLKWLYIRLMNYPSSDKVEQFSEFGLSL